MDYHNQSPQQVLQALQSDDHRGLTAQQAQQRQAQYGPNQLRGKKKKSLLRRFGTVKAVREAPLALLEEVLPRDAARAVWDRFHGEERSGGAEKGDTAGET